MLRIIFITTIQTSVLSLNDYYNSCLRLFDLVKKAQRFLTTSVVFRGQKSYAICCPVRCRIFPPICLPIVKYCLSAHIFFPGIFDLYPCILGIIVVPNIKPWFFKFSHMCMHVTQPLFFFSFSGSHGND